MSLDDANSFRPQYLEHEIIKNNPFATIGELGVSEMIKFTSEHGHATRKELKIGISGEHGGDSKLIKFGNKIGLSYVSCSPNPCSVGRCPSNIGVEQTNYTIPDCIYLVKYRVQFAL